MRKVHFLIFVILFSIAKSFYAQENENLKKVFSEWKNKNPNSPGYSVAIAKKGEIVYSESYGYENIEYNTKLNKNSVFDIASLAKQFTGFAIAKLILEDKISLEDNALKYIPELKNIKSAIKIKNLVYHTSGLRDVGELFPLANFGEDFTAKEALHLVNNQTELNFNVGSAYDYSNTNYVLLAVIVERITKISFKEWCHQHIFLPLKMNNSFVNDNPRQLIKNRAIAYYKSEDSFSYQQNNGMALIGSSAVYSTIGDMAKWMLHLHNNTKFPAIFKLMKAKGKTNDNKEIGYGFGLAIGNHNNSLRIEHSGATPSGFRSQIAIFPEEEFSFVILSNYGNLDPIVDFGFQIIETLSSKKPSTKEDVKNKERILISKEILKNYTGEYLFNNEMDVKVSLENDKLFFQLQGRNKDEVFAISKTKFELPGNVSVDFKLNKETNLMEADVFEKENKMGSLKRRKEKDNETKVNSINFDDYTGTYYSSELEAFITIKKINNQLELVGTKFGNVILKDKTPEVFTPNKQIASSIVFTSENDIINGFSLSRGSRAKNLKYRKLGNH